MTRLSIPGVTASQRWTPKLLGSTALCMWLDADDSSTLTLNGSKVSTWADKSGNSRNMTMATDSRRPTTVANVQNSRAVVRFARTGTNSTSSAMGNSSTGITGQPFTWIGAVKCATLPSSNNEFRVLNTDATGTGGGGNVGVNGSNNWIMWAGTVYQPVAATTDWVIVVGTFNGTSSRMWTNGTLRGTTGNSGTGYPSASLSLSCIATNETNHFDGDMAEVMFIGGTLSDANRERIEGYLAWRWGLNGSLPSGHPYKNYAP